MKIFKHNFVMLAGFLIVVLLQQEFTNAASDKNMQRLLMDLVSNSHKEVRPMRNNSDTLTIAISLKLHDIIELDFEKGILTTRITVEMVWNNYLMRWDPDGYDGIKHTVLPASKVWYPDIALYNSADDNHYFDGRYVKIYYTGYTEWKTTRTIKTYCEFNLDAFPKDVHHCRIKFGSWTYDGLLIDVQHKSGKMSHTLVQESTSKNKKWSVSPPAIDLSEFTPSSKWNPAKVDAANNHKYYECCSEPYIDLTFELTLERTSLIYKSPQILTWILLTLFPILIFLIPTTASNQKIGMGAGSFILTIFVTEGSKLIFLLKNFYIYTMIVNFIAICGVVAVVSTYSKNSKMPKFLKKFLPMLKKLTLISIKNENVKGNSNEGQTQNQTPGIQCIAKYLKAEEETESAKEEWKCFSSIINRTCFILITFLSIIGIFAFLM